MESEVAKILSMIENGKITAEQGAELLRALGKERVEETPRAAGGATGSGRPRYVGIHITDDDDKVDVKIPFGLVSCVEKFVPKGIIAKVRAGDQEIDLAEFVDKLRSETCGEILSVDAQDGTRIKICCE